MTHATPVAHRTVKPRKPSHKDLPIISYTDDVIYRERDDTYHDPSQICPMVLTEEPSLIVAQGIASLLLELHRHFHDRPDWQFGCAPIERKKIVSDKESRVTTRDTLVAFLGFQGKPLPDGPRGGKRHEANRYHSTLDPVTFARQGIGDLFWNTDTPTVEALYIWSTQVRRFCRDYGYSLRPTSGAVASQTLRDPRFYPHARRKVPARTNAVVRPELPGNHYRLYENEGTEFDAYYLDQIASHHSCARDIIFPHSNQLKAHGRFRTLEDKPGLPDKALSGHGLFYVRLSVPHLQASHFAPPYAQKQGMHTAYVYSNELPTLKQLGIHVEYVIAAWVSNARDRGLNRYAEWALEELTKEPHARAWKKPLLLSTYGILAATPRKHRMGFARASGGTNTLYPAGGGLLPVVERCTERESEPAYANVIHRGMIEAETRKRSLDLARDLHAQGHRVAAVYADSVFIHARDQWGDNVALPLPAAGWTVEAVLTRLRFHNPVSFTSDQMSKLPGIPNRDVVLAASRGVQHYGRRKELSPL